MSAALTRHLYSLDEVVSALQVCLRFRRNDEAAFWLWELVRSDEPTLALQTLQQIWLDFGGGRYAQEILAAKPTMDVDWLQLLSTTIQAIEHAGTASSVPLLLRTVKGPRPGTTPVKGLKAAGARPFMAALDPAEGMTRDQAGMWFLALNAAIQATRDPVDATWLIQAAAPILSAEAIWTALQLIHPIDPVVRAAATPHPVSQIQYQLTAMLLMLNPRDPPKRPLCLRWSDYDIQLGRRAARKFPIPAMALHVGTTRGQLPTDATNIAIVRVPKSHLSEGCAFWRAALRKIRDPNSEAFHAAYFPDDIPDEWSADDQQKSHGAGLGPNAPLTPTPALREEPVADLDAALTIRLTH
jgi:hypothetical protein